MTLIAKEQSTHDARPVELYLFTAGVRAWRYTSADDPQTYLGQSYSVVPLHRGRVAQADELSKIRVDIKTPRDTPIIAALMSEQEELHLAIFRRHRTDSEFVPLWSGWVVGFALEGAEATLSCEPLTSVRRRQAPRLIAQRQCPHALFSLACGVDKLAYEELGTVSLVTGAVVEASVFAGRADGWWVGGMLKNAEGVYRMITAHSGAQVTLASGLPGLVVGEVVRVYPGDDHTPETCNTRFGNILNYGGLSWLPIKNPFTGDASF